MLRTLRWTLPVALLVTHCAPLLAAEESLEDRWEETIQGFEAADAEQPPPENAVLFIGSSSIRFWPLEKYFLGIETINRGFGGSQTSDSLRYVHRIVIPYKPRVVVFYAGDNDINAGKPPERASDDFKAFAEALHAELPKTRILYLSIKPSIARWALIGEMRAANALIENYAQTDERITYVNLDVPMLGGDGTPREDLFISDGLHLSPKGYDLWTSIVTPYLMEEGSSKD